jgi:hypothetical protein
MNGAAVALAVDPPTPAKAAVAVAVGIASETHLEETRRSTQQSRRSHALALRFQPSARRIVMADFSGAQVVGLADPRARPRAYLRPR